MNTVKPDWQLKFRDLPEIHYSKRFIEGKKTTIEHDISFKLMANQTLTLDEIEILAELFAFYNEFERAINNFNFSSLKPTDLLNFRNYIIYVFNFLIEIKNEINFTEVYRIVKNESIIGNKNSLTNKSQLSYPTSEIVKKNNKYNRGNTPDFPMFYCSESMNTAIYELKPNVGDLVSIGVWRPKDNAPFVSFPITHNEKAIDKNITTTKARKAIDNLKENHDRLLTSYIENYLNLLGIQYSKKIKHHYEYIISAIISEKLLEDPYISQIDNKIECITYPSSENMFKSNLAIRPDVVDRKLNLFCVLEFEVTEQHFYRTPDHRNNSINLVNIKNMRMTTNIKEENIIW